MKNAQIVGNEVQNGFFPEIGFRNLTPMPGEPMKCTFYSIDTKSKSMGGMHMHSWKGAQGKFPLTILSKREPGKTATIQSQGGWDVMENFPSEVVGWFHEQPEEVKADIGADLASMLVCYHGEKGDIYISPMGTYPKPDPEDREFMALAYSMNDTTHLASLDTHCAMVNLKNLIHGDKIALNPAEQRGFFGEVLARHGFEVPAASCVVNPVKRKKSPFSGPIGIMFRHGLLDTLKSYFPVTSR